ncbi:MAG: hypothetical protein KBG07_05940 [Elusimicrobia bacterium]|nr:hypothetical protein [Elusimicrobiota bacterium]
MIASQKYHRENTMIGRVWKAVFSLWEDDPSGNPIVYDPVHVSAVIVGCLAAVGVLFWTLWALMVFEGGLFSKFVPFLQVAFTSKTWSDFGYEGYPYALGEFEGWVVNLAALAVVLTLLVAVRRFLHHPNNYASDIRSPPPS